MNCDIQAYCYLRQISLFFFWQVTFHRFPADKQLRAQWIRAIRRNPGEHFTITKSIKVCSKHFTEEDFLVGVASGRHLLKDNAVPSVFPFGKQALSRHASGPALDVCEPLTDNDMHENMCSPAHDEPTDTHIPETSCCSRQQEFIETKKRLRERYEMLTRVQNELSHCSEELAQTSSKSSEN